MIPLLHRILDQLLHDELAVRRWGRALLLAIGAGGLGFAQQLADLFVADGAPDPAWVKGIKAASVVALFLAGAVTAGEKNAPQPQPLGPNDATPVNP